MRTIGIVRAAVKIGMQYAPPGRTAKDRDGVKAAPWQAYSANRFATMTRPAQSLVAAHSGEFSPPFTGFLQESDKADA